MGQSLECYCVITTNGTNNPVRNYTHTHTHTHTHIDIYVVKLPWRRKWQPTPVFPPGESHGQRTLAGYSPWDGKESDMT